MACLDAVVFGAGKMACGLLGHILAKSGYKTLFVARRPEVIGAINRHGGYRVIVAGGSSERVAIRNCAAVSLHDVRRVTDAVAAADLVLTGVGIGNLTDIAPHIARGLWQRSQRCGHGPLNVVACENLPGAGAYLRHEIVSVAPPESALTVDRVGGFSAALTRRIMTGGQVARGELTFTVDDDCDDLTIDLHGLKDPLPKVRGARFTEEFSALVMRKLFLLNCAQAVAAYLGYRQRCRHVHEAAEHPHVAPAVRGAVAEARAALAAEFPHQARDIQRDAEEALARVANARLADPIVRLARDPQRKLSPRERLVGPARLAAKHDLPYESLALGIAAALTYDEPSDVGAVAMQEIIAAGGVERILTEDCGMLPHEDLARAVKQKWLGLVTNARRPLAGLSREGTRSLEQIREDLALELSRRYDRDLVNEVLARVCEEFQRARILTYVPVLMKRRASERLREALA